MCILLDTGNIASLFFHPKNRENVLSLYDCESNDVRESLSNLLQRFNVILRVVSSKKYVKPEFKNYCTTTYVMFLETFPWMNVNESAHRLLAHSWELIEQNNFQSLGQFSESPLESKHKKMRRVRQTLARLTNELDSFDDIFSRLYMSSCPLIRKQKPIKKQRAKSNIFVPSEDDNIVDMFLYEME